MATTPNITNMIQQGEVGNVAEFFLNQDSDHEATELDLSIPVPPPVRSVRHGNHTTQNSLVPATPMQSYFHASPVEWNTVNVTQSAERAL